MRAKKKKIFKTEGEGKEVNGDERTRDGVEGMPKGVKVMEGGGVGRDQRERRMHKRREKSSS